MEKLKERIGIDKTVICEIAIKAIDKEKLRKKSLQDGIYINFIENEKSPIVTKNGICISELEIKDDSIGRLLIKHKQNNLNIISGSFAGRPKFSQYCLRSIGFTKLKSIFSLILRKR